MKLADQLRAEQTAQMPFYKDIFLNEVTKCIRDYRSNKFSITKDEYMGVNTIPYMSPRFNVCTYPSINVHSCHFYEYIKLLQDNGFNIYQRGGDETYLYVSLENENTFEHHGTWYKKTF